MGRKRHSRSVNSYQSSAERRHANTDTAGSHADYYRNHQQFLHIQHAELVIIEPTDIFFVLFNTEYVLRRIFIIGIVIFFEQQLFQLISEHSANDQ